MSVQAAVAYVRKRQAVDGSFAGQASDTITPFVGQRKQPTVFPTILILECLRNVRGADDIRAKAVQYLEAQVSEQGAWNYWDVRSQAKNSEPYPDDLDDTACAMAALMQTDPAWVTASRLGQFTRLLVAVERRAGGPYNTWLIDTKKAPQWEHVDLAVNANIGYALSLQSVRLSGLMKYIDDALCGGELCSDYYVGQTPLLYFLSRWYDGSQLATLRSMIESAANQAIGQSAMYQALLLTAGCRLGIEEAQLRDLARELQLAITKDHWPAAALYVDPVYNGQQHFGGSDMLTTAFALEALTAYAQSTVEPSIKSAPRRQQAAILPSIRKDTQGVTNKQLKQRYLAAVNRTLQGAHGDQIASAASLVSHQTGWHASSITLRSLDLASLNGWVAYTIYDDFFDEVGSLRQLSVANLALRRSYGHLMEALPGNADFTALVSETFDTMDGANDWEQRYARATVTDGVLKLKKLPDYDDYGQLAERSLGHSLAACGVAVQHYGDLQHEHITGLRLFFKHFLIARQLNDDAHDWEEDLGLGHLSSVVSLLLQAVYGLPKSIRIADELEHLRTYFWTTSIHQVAVLIRLHIAQAHQALSDISREYDTVVFANWLEALEASVKTALQGREEAVQFIQAYRGSNE